MQHVSTIHMYRRNGLWYARVGPTHTEVATTHRTAHIHSTKTLQSRKTPTTHPSPKTTETLLQENHKFIRTLGINTDRPQIGQTTFLALDHDQENADTNNQANADTNDSIPYVSCLTNRSCYDLNDNVLTLEEEQLDRMDNAIEHTENTSECTKNIVKHIAGHTETPSNVRKTLTCIVRIYQVIVLSDIKKTPSTELTNCKKLTVPLNVQTMPSNVWKTPTNVQKTP
eukprot:jgi/Psemu1/311452/fgenesh1_kg.775_\